MMPALFTVGAVALILAGCLLWGIPVWTVLALFN
jgi:hypothetical protein